MRNVVGILTEQEKCEIQDLYEKKIALEHLSKIIDAETNGNLYKKLIKDTGETLRLFQNWWQKTSQVYHWEGENWYIDFETNEVISC